MNINENNNYLEIGALPDLRVIALDELAFHEEPDPHRLANMVQRMRTEGILKNPPIVAEPNGHKQYILLDGANRVSALLQWGFKDVLVQVVNLDDPLLDLQTWHHAVEKFGRESFEQICKTLPGISLAKGELLEPAKDLCSLTFSEGETIRVIGNGSLTNRVRDLKEITGVYLKEAVFDRVSYTNLEHLQKHYPDFQVLIRFRTFEKDDLVQLVTTGEKLPAGVTRVFLPKRALGLNISFDFLRSVAPLEEKNRRLHSLILEKVREKSIRFYREPTFRFDE
jgi:hypothetical protein